MNIGRTIDHLVYGVPDLTLACDKLEAFLGVRPVFGGHHQTKGTQNALLHLGGACYLEILAIDDANTAISPPRWMGLDLISESQITRWAIKSSDLPSDSQVLQIQHPQMGMISGGQRMTASGSLLAWEMILPLAEPAVEVLPFMVDWQRSESHPCDALEEGCRLVGFELGHPDPDGIQHAMLGLGLELKLEKADVPFLRAIVESPEGRVILG